MKRHILWILAIILIGVCGIMNGCKDPSSLPDQENGRNLLVKDEMSKYQIVLSSEAEASEVTAANELKKYIKSISGCSLEITDDTSAPSGHEIVIGQTARDVYGDFDWEWMGEEGYTVQMKDFTLVIAGGSGRGTLYGVYGFLESLGWRMIGAPRQTHNKILNNFRV